MVEAMSSLEIDVMLVACANPITMPRKQKQIVKRHKLLRFFCTTTKKATIIKNAAQRTLRNDGEGDSAVRSAVIRSAVVPQKANPQRNSLGGIGLMGTLRV